MKKIEGSINLLVNIGLILTILMGLSFPLVYTAFIKGMISSGQIMDKTLALNLGYICFYILYLPYLLFIFKLRNISKFLGKGDYFNRTIVKDLKTMGRLIILLGSLYLFINIALYMIYDIYLYALTILPSIIVPFVALTMGILFIFSGKLYSNIIDIKEENDLTI